MNLCHCCGHHTVGKEQRIHLSENYSTNSICQDSWRQRNYIGKRGRTYREKKSTLPPSYLQVNFQCLMTVLDNNEHITLATLLRLCLRNRMVFVFVFMSFSSDSTILVCESWLHQYSPDDKENIEITAYGLVISHRPSPLSQLVLKRSQLFLWETCPIFLIAGDLHILKSHLGSVIASPVREAQAQYPSLSRAKRGLHSPFPEFLHPLPSISQTLECTRITWSTC